MTSTITTVNPATGASLASYPAWTGDQIERAVARGAGAAADWGRQPLEARVAAVQRLAEELRRQKNTFASLITAEMGKPLAEAAGELEKSAVTAEYYANQAETILGDEQVQIDGVDCWISYEPIGLVLAVMPWNFPVFQVMRFAIPSITAGNGVLLKHSPNVTGSALALQQLFVDADLPEHLVTTLVVAEPHVPNVTEMLINDDRIAAVTLTGSNRAGAAVGAAAGRASKKSVLELGGSDAFVVLDDADVPTAAEAAVKARYHNAGQSCVCAKRFIIADSVAAEFTELFVKGPRRWSSVTRPTPPRRWGRWPGPTCATLCSARWRTRSPAELCSSPVADRSTATGTTTNRPYSPTPDLACRSSTRRPSVPSPRSPSPPTTTTRSGWPTLARSVCR